MLRRVWPSTAQMPRARVAEFRRAAATSENQQRSHLRGRAAPALMGGGRSHRPARPTSRRHAVTPGKITAWEGRGLARFPLVAAPFPVPSPSNRACGSPAHGSRTSFTDGIRFAFTPTPQGPRSDYASMQVNQPQAIARCQQRGQDPYPERRRLCSAAMNRTIRSRVAKDKNHVIDEG